MKNEIEMKKIVKIREDNSSGINIKLRDNSNLFINDENWLFALKSKLNDEDMSFEEFKSFFVKDVEKHWNNKTVPSKWPWDFTWERELEDDIWHKLYRKLDGWEEKEEKKSFGYPVSSLIPVKWFDKEVKEKNARIIRDGVAVKDNKLILRNGTEEAKICNEISDRYANLIKKETEKEFEKRRKEADNKYKSQAELAKEVLYYHIRGRLMGIILSKATDGKTGGIATSDNSVSIIKHDFIITKKYKPDEGENER